MTKDWFELILGRIVGWNEKGFDWEGWKKEEWKSVSKNASVCQPI